MTVSAPPRPPSPARTAPDSKPLEREEIEALVEALIEEARREQRRRHRRYWALAALATFVGVVVLILLDGGAASQTASPALSARSGAAGGTPSFEDRLPARRPRPAVPLRPYTAELYVMNADGSGLRRLTRVRGRATTRRPRGTRWSPDGRKLVFAQAGRAQRRAVQAGRPLQRRDLRDQRRRHRPAAVDAKRCGRRPPRLVTGRAEDRLSRAGATGRTEHLRDERRRQRPAEADANAARRPGSSRPGRPTGRRSRSVHQPVTAEPRTSS